jgi:hypothetical protein
MDLSGSSQRGQGLRNRYFTLCVLAFCDRWTRCRVLACSKALLRSGVALPSEPPKWVRLRERKDNRFHTCADHRIFVTLTGIIQTTVQPDHILFSTTDPNELQKVRDVCDPLIEMMFSFHGLQIKSPIATPTDRMAAFFVLIHENRGPSQSERKIVLDENIGRVVGITTFVQMVKSTRIPWRCTLVFELLFVNPQKWKFVPVTLVTSRRVDLL